MIIDRPANIPENLVETDTVALARQAVKLAVSLQYPVHIIGRPGTGKSSALWHIAQEFGGFYCEISQASKGTKGMFELLLQTVGWWNGQKYTSQLAEDCYHFFEPRGRTSTRLLVVDEVQTLEATAFRELLRIQEKCRLALVIAGNQERLAGKKADKATWEQIESRIAMQRHLPGPSRRDCELIGSTFNVEGTDAYDLLSAYGIANNFRDLVQLLETALRLGGGGTGIRKLHLEAAYEILGGKPETLKAMQIVAA